MADTRVKTEAICCNSETHGLHLCYIMSQGLHLSDPASYIALIENPKCRCQHCGRTARSRTNLCVPESL